VTEGAKKVRSTVRFDLFEVTPDGDVRRAGLPVPLQEQPLRILLRLLETPGHLVTREELRQQLWATDTFVDFEHGLNAAIRRLRGALGDSADTPRFIETVPRRGYRFIANIDHEQADPPQDRQPRRWTAAFVLGGIALVVLIGLPASRRPGPAATMESVAVLPFENLTGDPKQDYFVDGLTEAVASELARSTPARVVSGISSVQYKHVTKPARVIARELGGVAGLIEGTVTHDGDRVRVTVDLIDPKTDVRVWAESYQRDVSDIFALYRDVARAVAPALHTATSVPRRSVSEVRPIEPDAYDAFLQGLYFRRRWQAGGCLQAEPYLQRAVALDPMFADAYAQLAYCYVFPDRTMRPGWQTGPQARALVARALELDGTSALAHAMLGRISLHFDFDWVAAQREFERAIDLNPAEPVGHESYGELLYASGRDDQGLKSVREALRLDPLSADFQTAYGFALRSVGRFDQAISQLQRVVEHEPNWAMARFWLAYTYADAGRRDEAVGEYLRFLEQVITPERASEIEKRLAETYRQSGWEPFWRQELRLAEEDLRTPGSIWRASNSYYSGPFSMARRYARVGDRDRAIEWLEKAYTYRHHLMFVIDRELLFADLRNDARFQDIRRRVGLTR
jgi:TolB-like protein/DNA-binding winged helix-turn-helix (wHTH) protein/Tfp pilus assembly protein PilF